MDSVLRDVRLRDHGENPGTGQDATLAPGWGWGDVKRRFTCPLREEKTKLFRIAFSKTVTSQEIHAKLFGPLDDSLLFTFPFHVC
jgi:hypothetical protein